MNQNDENEGLDRVFMALADKTRRAMVHRLTRGEMTVSLLVDGFDMSYAAASKHIKVLESANLVLRRIEGRVHYISLAPERLGIALDWISIYRNFWQSRLDNLASSLENNEGEPR